MAVDLKQPAFLGLDGNVFSIYLTCDDVGCFMIYSPILNRIHFTTVSLEKAGEVEEVLFKRCSDGYVRIDNEMLISFYSQFEERYQKNTEKQNLLF